MFTGIIEELGKIQHISSNKITILASKVLEGTKIGDSIAVNGVCLTVCEISDNSFSADVSYETLKVTALGELKQNDFVNLERAMKADGRFGGHIVSGHIDGIAKFVSTTKVGEFYDLKIELDKELAKYVVKKGSIAINGISLTVADIKDKTITCAIIPHTFNNTCIKYLSRINFVNIETDIFAKYVENFLSRGDNRSRIDLKFLEENWF